MDALTPDIARQLSLPAATRGIVVSSVDPNSPAAEGEDGGLTRGDVIQEVNHKPISTVDQFRMAVQAAGTQPLLLLVNRGGRTQFVVVSPQQ